MKNLKQQIKELGIEVEKELRKPVLEKDIKIPKGWRLLTFSEASYILENDILDLGFKEIEWITLKGKVAGLDSYRDVGGFRLRVDGSYWDSSSGCAFGVRFCRSLMK